MAVVGCVAGRAGGREKGGVGLGCMGMGGVCGWGRREEEGGGEGEGGGERATDSIEPQNSHKQSLLSGLVRHFHIFRKSFDMLFLVQTPNQF